MAGGSVMGQQSVESPDLPVMNRKPLIVASVLGSCLWAVIISFVVLVRS